MFWRVPSGLRAVIAYIKFHPPRGSQLTGIGSESGPGVPPTRYLTFSFAPLGGRISTRWLNVTAVALPHRQTGVRVDAQDVWIVPRPASEKVPADVHEIDVTSGYPGKQPSTAVSVTNPAQVRQIVRWFDALDIAQPGAYSCPVVGGPTVTLTFRAANGVPVAQASGLDFQGTSGPCNPIQFSIRGRRQKPLSGGEFFNRVQRVIGIGLD